MRANPAFYKCIYMYIYIREFPMRIVDVPSRVLLWIHPNMGVPSVPCSGRKMHLRMVLPPATVVGLTALLIGTVFVAATAEAAKPAATQIFNPSAGFDSWLVQSMVSYGIKSQKMAKQGNKTLLLSDVKTAESSSLIITVRQDGGGDFKKVSDAVKSVPSGNTRRTIIKIYKGVYKERFKIDRSRPFITLYGDPLNMPTISGYATAKQYGTYESATVSVDADNFVAVNIIFENTAPKPPDGAVDAQAVALKIAGDMAAFYNCRFYGYQDTLCDAIGRHYFKNCFIQGTVDFVFGDGRSLYSECELRSVADGVTYITAQGRENQSDQSGFSFVDCRVTGTGQAYLGRAWKTSSRVVFAQTYFGDLISAAGWDDYRSASRQKTVYYGEYDCKGPGAVHSNRAQFVRMLTSEQAKPFMSKTFIDGDSWLTPPPNLSF